MVFKATELVTAETGFILKLSNSRYNVSNIPPWGMLLNSGSQIFFNKPLILSKIWGLSWQK